jgi:hypothetical protein
MSMHTNRNLMGMIVFLVDESANYNIMPQSFPQHPK